MLLAEWSIRRTELATQTHNTIRVPGSSATYPKLANPTPLQTRALALADTITTT